MIKHRMYIKTPKRHLARSKGGNVWQQKNAWGDGGGACTAHLRSCELFLISMLINSATVSTSNLICMTDIKEQIAHHTLVLWLMICHRRFSLCKGEHMSRGLIYSKCFLHSLHSQAFLNKKKKASFRSFTCSRWENKRPSSGQRRLS